MARAFWKGTISFGLLNIPVGLYSSEEKSEELHFTMIDPRNMARIRFKRVNEKTGKEVPYGKIEKGYEYAKNEFVLISQKDIEAANPRATHAIDVEDFVNVSEIDPVFFEKPYFVVPEKNGAKGYNLLRDALDSEKKAAVGTIVMHTKQHLVAIIPRGKFLVLEQLRFAHEMRADNRERLLETKGERTTYSARELKMAKALVREMTRKWKPEKFRDTYYLDLMNRIKAKIKAGEGEVVSEGASEAPKPSNMVDLMPLLEKSLAERGRGRSRGKGRRRAA